MGYGMNPMMYHWLGAHPLTQDGVTGTRFAVWAPNAKEVCVLLDRNHWKHGAFYLSSSDEGVWTGFIPEVAVGETYKYSLKTPVGNIIQKNDPYGFQCEAPPKTASIVTDLKGYEWGDADWISNRQHTDWLDAPISIYEVHLGSWKRPWDGRSYHTYDELADMLIQYVQEMGFTHVQLMPITEYPFDGSWGYQATGYFAPTARYGTPHDFMGFVDKLHQAGIGVLLDWVPGHFPTDGHSLGQFDGTSLYEHSDPRQGFHPDWNTNIFNYGRNEVRNFLLSSARFWCDMYHLDGLRVDAVASMLYLDYSREPGEWIPNKEGGRENLEAIQFLKDMNTLIHGDFPGVITVAEESTSWPKVSRPVYDGGLGFTFKWDMGWMNDTLRYMRRDPIHRKHHQNELSFRTLYQFTENFMLPLSHDEVVHGKGSLYGQMPGDKWQKFANLRLLFGYQYTVPGKPLLFMGCEIGQPKEWNHDSQIDWELLQEEEHMGLKVFVRDLNHLLRELPALYDGDVHGEDFEWIQADDSANSVYVFMRRSRKQNQTLIVAFNMTPVPRSNYLIGVPKEGTYRELLNSDGWMYGGSGVGNAGEVDAEMVPMHGRSYSIEVTLPPLGMLIFEAVNDDDASK
ncbi:MAG: 1,4-alpha-glucan branching protein GlgB [Planctomycetaceae bacterium]|nr:1,4-alpha-glucan branching protein GlgB [Planctomycetaceae bacterium]